MAEEESERRFSGKLAYKDNGLVELWVTEGDRKTPELSFRGMSPTASPFILP